MITSIRHRLLFATVAICGASMIFAGSATASQDQSNMPSATAPCLLHYPSCGSYEMTALALDMATNNSHSVIEAKVATDATNNNTEDFQANAVSGFTVFQFDPFGNPSGLCVTAQSANLHAGIVLKACTNNPLQLWRALSGGIYELSGTVYVLSDPYGGGQYTLFQLRNNSGSPGQRFMFVKF